MTQSELNREVSAVTGESLSTIAERGFVPLTCGPMEREPQVMDWDEPDAESVGYLDELVEVS
jgi:hypothetical protein